jgi:hypothetical protein
MADAIDYRAVLADLRARRTAIDQAIAAVENIIGEGSSALPTSQGDDVSVLAIQPDTFVGLNIAEAASKYLRTVGRPARTTEQVADALRRGGLSVTLGSVSAILRRNNNSGEGDVIKVGRGLWGLQEWYPGRPRRSNRQSSEEGE